MMSILNAVTIILSLASVLFTVIFVFMNVVPVYSDVEERSQSVLSITKISMWLTLLFLILSCLLGDGSNIAAVIAKTSSLFRSVAVHWLIALLICGIGMLYCVLSKNAYRKTRVAALKSIFKVVLIISLVSILMSWLLS